MHYSVPSYLSQRIYCEMTQTWRPKRRQGIFNGIFPSVLPLYPHSYPHTLSPYHTALYHTPADYSQQPPATEPGPSDCHLITTSNLRLSSWRVSSVRGSRRKQAQLRIDTQIAIARDQGCANVLQAWFRLDRLKFCARWCERPDFWFGYCLCQRRLSTNGGKRTNFSKYLYKRNVTSVVELFVVNVALLRRV
jgi:hypothetical protein